MVEETDLKKKKRNPNQGTHSPPAGASGEHLAGGPLAPRNGLGHVRLPSSGSRKRPWLLGGCVCARVLSKGPTRLQPARWRTLSPRREEQPWQGTVVNPGGLAAWPGLAWEEVGEKALGEIFHPRTAKALPSSPGSRCTCLVVSRPGSVKFWMEPGVLRGPSFSEEGAWGLGNVVLVHTGRSLLAFN